MDLYIRQSTLEDLPRLIEIYNEAREIMLSCGNLNQWKPGYPTQDMIRTDIENGHSYAVVQDGFIIGSFAFIPGEDPTYRTIECGNWIDDQAPYATIHRLASTKHSRGVAAACFDWCWSQIQNLRVDTHEDNVIMRHCIHKAGFKYCGVIHLLNGAPRLAFQKVIVQ